VVAVITPYEVIASGLRALLEASGAGAGLSFCAKARPDVVFYDVVGLHQGDGSDLDHWVQETSAVVIALTQDIRPDLTSLALRRGAKAAIPLGADPNDLVRVLEAARCGHLDRCPIAHEQTRVGHEADADLTSRETEIVGLIVQGLSNGEIAAACNLSRNTVKSYIRFAYRKMGVKSRTQAVRWGIEHGFPLAVDPPPAP
jgi:DNA-binding NarL/FixJ family response regulator